MKIIDKKLTDLQAYENNPRNNDNAVDAVANSIKEFGFKQPVIIDTDGVIVAGHTRIKAAQQLGLQSVPCIVADDLTDEQIKAFRIADNKTAELADWDYRLLLAEIEGLKSADYDISNLGFDDVELKQIADECAQLMDAEVEAEDDDYNIVFPDEPKTKTGDLYILGEHRLLCADATNAESYRRLMGGAIADLLLTDVPYNVDYGESVERLKKFRPNSREESDIINDNMTDEQYEEFLKQFIQNAFEVIKAGAAFYVWYANMKSLAIFNAFNIYIYIYIATVVMGKKSFCIGAQRLSVAA